jgi:hypothetical protein
MPLAQIFQPTDAPQYIPGKAAIMILLTIQLAISLVLRWINMRLNKKKLEFLEAEKARHGWTEEDVQKERDRHAFLDMTDKVSIEREYQIWHSSPRRSGKPVLHVHKMKAQSIRARTECVLDQPLRRGRKMYTVYLNPCNITA